MADKNISSSSPLSELIRVRSTSVRSINVEQDLDNSLLASSYILTAKAREILNRIISEINAASPKRAWTLTGLYGTGKSFFSLFLLNLLSPTQAAHSSALIQLHEVDPLLAQKVAAQAQISATQGFLPIAITGFRGSFFECLRKGIIKALLPHSNSPEIQELTQLLAEVESNKNSRWMIEWLQTLLGTITSEKFGYAGVLLIFDEMGKPLEYTATHPENSDIYLLQEIAEFANRSSQQRLVFIGVLHQSFDIYALKMDSNTQKEWQKIQGRFEDIGFQEPPAQQMWLIANAIENFFPQSFNGLMPEQESLAQEIINQSRKSLVIREQDFINLSLKAYPLHPLTLLALPHVFRRLAQNERSVFAFLSSHEPYSFQEFLSTHRLPDRIRIPDLFNYLTTNFEGRLYTSSRARMMTEALERLNNSVRYTEIEADVLKTIAFLNWLGDIEYLAAKEDRIIGALRSPEHSDEEIRSALQSLKMRSIIVFRRYNNTYAIWQGSDVDLEERMQQAQERLTGAFSLADTVQEYLPPRSVIARRHSYNCGTQRFFELRYVDTLNLSRINLEVNPQASGIVFLCLPASEGESKEFISWFERDLSERTNILVGIANRTTRITELAFELRCLYWVSENTPELRDDPVARRELRTRIGAIDSLIRLELDKSLALYRLSDSIACSWYWRTGQVETRDGENLSHLLSMICDVNYPSSPSFKNELLNRRLLSSQASAARRNLLEGMLSHADQPLLGFQGYPPERSMYASLLLKDNLHQRQSNRWVLLPPAPDDPLNLYPAWQAMEDYVFQQPPMPRPVADLFTLLSAPPYGLTDGLLPVVLCLFSIIFQNETTLYREGTLLPEPGIPDWEVLLRRPELYMISGCRVVGTRAAILQRLGRGLGTQPQVMAVVRTLIRQMRSLPEHAWRTNRLPEEVLAFRRAIEVAHSPEQLLFHDLPKALGLQPFEGEEVDNDYIDEFFTLLNQALTTLSTITPTRRDEARDILLEKCGLSAGSPGWQKLVELSLALAPTVNQPMLQPMLKRVAEAASTLAGVESVLALISNRPLRTWSDLELERFPEQAQHYGKLFQAELAGSPIALRLSPDEQSRSQQIAQELQEHLSKHYQDDPRLLLAALRKLLDENQL